MRDQQLNFVLTAAGLGPLASFIQAFVPSLASAHLAKQLNRTFLAPKSLPVTGRPCRPYCRSVMRRMPMRTRDEDEQPEP